AGTRPCGFRQVLGTVKGGRDAGAVGILVQKLCGLCRCAARLFRPDLQSHQATYSNRVAGCNTRSRSRSSIMKFKLALSTATALCLMMGAAMANDNIGVIVQGTATIDSTNSTALIDQDGGQ